LAPLYVERGDLYREDENWEEAEADFNRAAALAPHWAAVDFFRGKLRAATDQLEAARRCSTKYWPATPMTAPRGWNGRGCSSG
jgi:tetratricopeptide (TPR) repeat protein